MSHLSITERNIDREGAATLVNTLMNHDDKIHQSISYWQRSINAQHAYMTESQKLGAKNIKDWYDSEGKTRSYSVPGWKVSPERTALIEKFRDDPNYHIKNIVELIIRTLILEMIQADGKDVKVYVTSDSDDVCGGADAIAVIDTNHGEEYVAFDIAVSENFEYLSKKATPTETHCHEFNAFKKRKDRKPIPRVVFDIPPRVMAGFIIGYMKQVEKNGFMIRKDILPLLKASASQTVRDLSKKVHSRIDSLIHPLIH